MTIQVELPKLQAQHSQTGIETSYPDRSDMPNFGSKISSAYITVGVMREFIAHLPSLMRDIYGNRNLNISYGLGCCIHQDLWYKSMNVPLDVFPYFIEDSVGQGIYQICGSDLLIESPDSNVKILLCHESDIHIDGSDDESIAKVVARFPSIDFRSAEDWKVDNNTHAKSEVGSLPSQ